MATTFKGFASDWSVPANAKPGLGALAKEETAKLWDSALAALDLREQRGVVIAQASDSTGDANSEWFELAWRAAFTDVWPERPARVCRWSTGGTGSYSAWESWQTGEIVVPAHTGAVYADDFSTDGTSIIGNTALNPDVGSPYTEFASHASYWAVSGGKLTRSGPDDGVRATIRADWNARDSKDFDFTGLVNVPSWTSNTEVEIMVVSNTEGTARVSIEIPGSGDATLTQYFDSAVTVLGTFPAGTYTQGAEAGFGLNLTGTTLTATLGANTLTATLTQAQVDTLAVTTRTVIRSQIPAATFDDLVANSTVPESTEPAGAPQVDVYNGGAAGKTAEYQRANLAAMYPVRPDVLFVNHCHNYDPAYGWDIAGFLGSVQGLVDDLEALYPGDPIPVVVTSQNPQFGSGREADHLSKIKALRGYAARHGWGYIPTFEAFAKRPDGGEDQMQDALHPALGTGRVLQGDVAELWIKSQSERV